ncbi:ABC transporter permease [Clostridium sp. FP1]|uniref:ABC transporter permease n=1 Tax=Clostridium sp. FP1 TaxID=2724076 RepID=UPI0013E98E37|nr:ABC transporter permease [Clostridium sp. FP1]MBZ9635259.1 ABC transporter permease [Clostridium sp. FP1]
MWRLRIILKSISKQGVKFKLVFFQLIIIFISLNFAFTLINKNLDLKYSIDKLVDKDKSVMIGLSVPSIDKDPINSIDRIYEKISRNKVVNKIGSFHMNKIKIKKEEFNAIYLNRGAFDLYNINVCKGTIDLFNYKKSKDEIPIVISNDLSKKWSLGSIFTLEMLQNSKLINLKFKVVGITNSSAVFWNSRNGGQPSINTLKNSLIIPFDKQYFYDNGINFTMKTGHTIVSVKKSQDLKQFTTDFSKLNNNSNFKYIEINDLITQIYEESKPWITLSLTFAVLLSVLSLVGFVGIMTNYITFRKREYGIRFALGSTSKELSRLVCGEFLIALIITNLISIFPIIITSYIFGMDLTISLIIKSIFPSFSISLAILAMTFFIYKSYILKKNIVDLIRGN